MSTEMDVLFLETELGPRNFVNTLTIAKLLNYKADQLPENVKVEILKLKEILINPHLLIALHKEYIKSITPENVILFADRQRVPPTEPTFPGAS
jgi:hypothetical protein